MHSVVILTIVLAHPLQEFQKRLAGSGIEFYAAHPGIAKSGIFDRMEASWDKPLSTLLVRFCGAESRVHGPAVRLVHLAGACRSLGQFGVR